MNAAGYERNSGERSDSRRGFRGFEGCSCIGDDSKIFEDIWDYKCPTITYSNNRSSQSRVSDLKIRTLRGSTFENPDVQLFKDPKYPLDEISKTHSVRRILQFE